MKRCVYCHERLILNFHWTSLAFGLLAGIATYIAIQIVLV